MSDPLDYIEHLTRESTRFGEALREAAPDAPVPSCPDWNADDLLWHLGEVQWFWGTIVRENVTGSQAEDLKPARPGDRAGLLAFYEDASRRLPEILAARTPDTPAWTWSDDHSVGFIRRRQAHEALMHRVDAELTVGSRSPMDPDLSADGVDEALRIMYGDIPTWGTITVEVEGPLRLRSIDTGDSWLVQLGRLVGAEPGDDTPVDELAMKIADSDHGDDAAATVSGSAADLDAWLWRRPTAAPVERSGDHQVLDRLESTIEAGIS